MNYEAKIRLTLAALLWVALATPAAAAQQRMLKLEDGLELSLQQIEYNRIVPHGYVDQGLATIAAIGREEVLLSRRFGTLGSTPGVHYSLIVNTLEAAPAEVSISGEVVIGEHALVYRARVERGDWQSSLLVVLEALAQLPTRHAAVAGLLGADPSAPPETWTRSGVTVRQLGAPVAIDGRDWKAAQPVWPGQAATSGDGSFTIAMREVNEEGDVARALVLYQATGSVPVRLVKDPVAYALISPDSRWVILEPLTAIDLVSWRRYELHRQQGIEPYVAPQAVSADGRRIVFARQSCAVDCAGAQKEYFEMALPE